MRNPIIQALQPGTTLGIVIQPPMADHERHYLLTGLGHGAVRLDHVASDRVVISNPTHFVAPFVFFIGPKTFLPPAISRLAKLLGNY